MKKTLKKLFVKATPSASVHEISSDGEFGASHGQARRIVGKRWNPTTEEFEIIEEGVEVFYHPEYIKHLKERSLLPVTQETALLAGVSVV